MSLCRAGVNWPFEAIRQFFCSKTNDLKQLVTVVNDLLNLGYPSNNMVWRLKGHSNSEWV